MCDFREESTVSTKKGTDRHEKIKCFQLRTVLESGNSRWVNNSHNLCCWVEDLVLEDLVFRSWPLATSRYWHSYARQQVIQQLNVVYEEIVKDSAEVVSWLSQGLP